MRQGRPAFARATVSEPYTFRDDHAELLRIVPVVPAPARRSSPRQLVVVPNHLHPDRLDFAAELAVSLSCPLLVTCVRANRDLVVATLDRCQVRPVQTWVVGLDWPAPMPLRGLRTPLEPGARSDRHRDVAAKRNLGLALARMIGLRRVLFLDDDVRGISAARLEDATRWMSPFGITAMGWRCDRFEDNSIVCHVRRLVGQPQGIFIGGGLLAVDVTAAPPLFPPTYNEDWLFLYDLLAAEGVAIGGAVNQLPQNPFAEPGRAADQEFGDVLGEGLYHLLHERRRTGHELDPERAADHPYWARVLSARWRLLAHLADTLQAAGRGGPAVTVSDPEQIRAAQDCLAAAARQHTPDLVSQLVSFVRAWRHDLRVWRHWFTRLDRSPTIGEALNRMHLPPDCLATV